MQLGFVLLWLIESLAPVDVTRRSPEDRAELDALLAGLQADPLAAMARLPILTSELVRLARNQAGRTCVGSAAPTISPAAAAAAVACCSTSRSGRPSRRAAAATSSNSGITCTMTPPR